MDKTAKEQKQILITILRESQVKEHVEQAGLVSSQRKLSEKPSEVLKE